MSEVRRPRIPVAGPWITEKEVAYAADAARTGWYETAGEYNRRFEQAFAAYVGVRHAISVPHCTAAIHLALAALGVGPGDEVVVPDLTWIASAAPVTYVGATPVFADVDPATWCLDPAAFEAVVSHRTRAVIPVDLYGGMPDMDGVLGVAERHGIEVVEDAAEAVGSEYHGRRSGSFGRAGVFSFHGSKTLATGEGGMLVTDDDALRDRVLYLRDHGRNPGERTFWNTEVAFKYRMSALQAAVGLAQTERIEELVARKREIFRWYEERLSGVPGLSLNPEPAGTKNTYWMVTVLLDPALGWRKEQVQACLDEAGIDARPFFHPLSSLPAYADVPGVAAARERNVRAYSISPYGVNLPSALRLTESDVEVVCRALLRFLGHASAAHCASPSAASGTRLGPG
jgi:perosamine synthetase